MVRSVLSSLRYPVFRRSPKIVGHDPLSVRPKIPSARQLVRQDGGVRPLVPDGAAPAG